MSNPDFFSPIFLGINLQVVPRFKVGDQWGWYEGGVIKLRESVLTDNIEEIVDANWVPKDAFDDLNELHNDLNRLMKSGRNLLTPEKILAEEKLLFGDDDVQINDGNDPSPQLDFNRFNPNAG